MRSLPGNFPARWCVMDGFGKLLGVSGTLLLLLAVADGVLDLTSWLVFPILAATLGAGALSLATFRFGHSLRGDFRLASCLLLLFAAADALLNMSGVVWTPIVVGSVGAMAYPGVLVR